MGIFNTLFDIYGHDTLWAWYINLVIGSIMVVAYFIYFYKQHREWEVGDTVFGCALYLFGTVIIAAGIIVGILAVILIVLSVFYDRDNPICVGDIVVSSNRDDNMKYKVTSDNGDGTYDVSSINSQFNYTTNGDILKVVKRSGSVMK